MEACPSANTPSGLLVANVLTHAVGGKVPVRLMNPSQKPVILPERARVAELSKPQKGLPKEVVALEEVAGELRVRALACEKGAVSKQEEPGPLSVPVQANLQGLTS